MKKILLLPILFILSACQPSELDRCLEANGYNISVNDYFEGELELEKKLLDIDDYRITGSLNEAQLKLSDNFYDNLNKVELTVYQCVEDSKVDAPIPDDLDFINDLKPRVDSCIESNKDKLENLILEQKETAMSICHAQGIY